MKKLEQTPISVLDLVPYPQGSTVADAFRNTRDLAQHAEKWGFKRYWMAEHHNLEGIASAATPLLIGYVAGSTNTIRVGSGGIMLPNHAPLVVAEQFGTLATLYPNRIDLGLGRAPGSDQITMHAMRRGGGSTGDDFPELISELEHYFGPPGVGQRVKAIPGMNMEIPIWILGSSLYSAKLAALMGRPYAFAGHFAPGAMLDAVEMYRRDFKPSQHLEKPHVMIGVPVVAADTDERAEFLSTSVYQRFLGLVRGQLKPTQPPVKDMSELWNPREEANVKSMMRTLVVGGPETVRAGLQNLIDATQADEIIMTSDCFAHADRLRSYEIVSEVAMVGVKSSSIEQKTPETCS